ncbi:MAG: uracil-DNA glycosylase [Massilibacteroides sp.]|nr:uracil-DNA glycosylase [Massilibacteroides sp.]
MEVKIEPQWKEKLQHEFEEDYFKNLVDFVKDEYNHAVVYPPSNLLFNAFDLCPFDKVKVVILGQDPYHEPHQAHGLCFSVESGTKFPPSLKNIYKELQTDLGIVSPQSGDISSWAKQGVLLLNATLTVRAHQAGSHQNKGWERFTDAVIHKLNEERQHIVYILWGNYAQRKAKFLDNENNLILKAPHPSPLSSYRGFFGSKPFSKTNTYLKETAQEPIDWQLIEE